MNWVPAGIFAFVAVVAAFLTQVGGRPIVIGDSRYSPAPVLWVTAAVALAVAVVLFLRAFRRDYVVRHGAPARAEIISVEETSMRVNEQPLCRFRLRVVPEAGQPYEGFATRVVGVGDAYLLAPGTSLNVKVHPRRPDNIVIVD